MNIACWLTRTARTGPDRPALYQGSTLIADYGGFHRQAARLAGQLQARGIRPGDRVAIFLKNGPDYLIALYGIWYAGAVAVPVNAKLHTRELSWILQDAGAELCFALPEVQRDLHKAGCALPVETVEAALKDAAGFAPVEVPLTRTPEDLAWLFYTSGTTGQPKGVMITHRMLAAMSLSYLADVDPVEPGHATLYAAPMSHGAGLYALVHVLKGARHICPASGGFDPVEIFGLAEQFGDVHMFAAPTMVKRMTQVARDGGWDGAGLRSVVYAGGPMYLADILEATDHFGPIFLQIYGQGECPMAITALSRHDIADRGHPRWHDRLASVGRAQSVVEVQVGDEQGRPCPEGVTGEIMVRGDAVMPGYWRNPDASAKALKGGWLWTGDLGHMDADGYVTLQDRSKDMIISGGSNIYPREVEEVLLQHPQIREASVVGCPNPDWGEEVVAFIVAEPEVDPAALEAHCLDHIARFKRPKRYIVVDELPKNNYGKVLKTDLRARLHADRSD